ncbi:MAG TPA: right-handed parallel beta-helix repeat-containing protein [Spirochaetia bacterium]|nr:right-handed parallel beta-helix repeat-containing protein [Spirochaetia bacterium]
MRTVGKRKRFFAVLLLTLATSATLWATPVLSVMMSAEPDFGPENASAVLSVVSATAAETGAFRVVTAAEREAAIRELEFSLSDLAALRSNTVVTLTPGTYDLSNRNDVRQPHLSWNDHFDGFYPVITSVSNLTLRGEHDVKIVIHPRYGWIMEFQTGRDIRIENIRFVHTTPGFCLGGVLRFELCKNVSLQNIELEGSGTYGLELTRTNNVTVSGSTVRNCTYGIMECHDSRDILFLDSVFTNNGEFTLIEINHTSNINFIQCEMTDNWGDTLVSADTSSFSIVFTRCTFARNQVHTQFHDRERLRFEE